MRGLLTPQTFIRHIRKGGGRLCAIGIITNHGIGAKEEWHYEEENMWLRHCDDSVHGKCYACGRIVDVFHLHCCHIVAHAKKGGGLDDIPRWTTPSSTIVHSQRIYICCFPRRPPRISPPSWPYQWTILSFGIT